VLFDLFIGTEPFEAFRMLVEPMYSDTRVCSIPNGPFCTYM